MRRNDDALHGARAEAKRNWIQEERRRTLGDWVAFCPGCGHVARYFEEHEEERARRRARSARRPSSRAVPACDARLPSAFQVECEECGAELRPNELFGSADPPPGGSVADPSDDRSGWPRRAREPG